MEQDNGYVHVAPLLPKTMLNSDIYLLEGSTRTRIFDVHVIDSLAALLRSATTLNNIRLHIPDRAIPIRQRSRQDILARSCVLHLNI